MTDTTGGDWRASLAAVERGIDDCLAALDRYEQAFARVLAEPARLSAPAPLPPPADWDERMAAPVAASDEVERLLAEQQAAWARWQAALGDWRATAGGA
jgi:hypothetical protein